MRALPTAATFLCFAMASQAAAAEAPRAAQSTPQAVASVQPVAKKNAAPQAELGFFDKFFPFGLNKDLSEPVQRVMIPVWITSACICPPVGYLVGDIMLGDDSPKQSDALMVSLVHTGTIIVWAVLTSVIIGIPLLLIDDLYLTPVAILNAFDRGIKAQNGQGAVQPRRQTVAAPMAMAY